MLEIQIQQQAQQVKVLEQAQMEVIYLDLILQDKLKVLEVLQEQAMELQQLTQALDLQTLVVYLIQLQL
jgi:hypothetical protein